MEYRDVPFGKIRIPDELRHAAWTENALYYWGEGGMGIIYWRADVDLDGKLRSEDDGAIGEAVAHIFMTEERFANAPRVIDAFLEMRSQLPPADEPGI